MPEPLYVQSPDGTPSPHETTGQDLRQHLRLYSEGLVSGGAVTAAAGMNINVAALQAIVEGDDSTDQGNYLATLGAAALSVAPAPGSGTRYDAVVVQINDEQAGGTGGGAPFQEVTVVTGTVGAGVPVVPDTAILIATLGPIIPSTTTLTGLISTTGAAVSYLAVDLAPNSVQTTHIGDATITNAKFAAPVGGGMGGGAIIYRRVGPMVSLWQVGPISASSVTLPVGYRPPARVHTLAVNNDDHPLTMYIETNGVINMASVAIFAPVTFLAV